MGASGLLRVAPVPSGSIYEAGSGRMQRVPSAPHPAGWRTQGPPPSSSSPSGSSTSSGPPPSFPCERGADDQRHPSGIPGEQDDVLFKIVQRLGGGNLVVRCPDVRRVLLAAYHPSQLLDASLDEGEDGENANGGVLLHGLVHQATTRLKIGKELSPHGARDTTLATWPAPCRRSYGLPQDAAAPPTPARTGGAV